MNIQKNCRRLLSVFVLVSVAVLLKRQMAAQAPPKAERPEFEVATVKPAKQDQTGGGIRPLPGGQSYIAQNVPVRLIIMLMFHLTDTQVAGGPSWIGSDRWDIEAKAEHPASVDELHVMFQNLLIDRFNLKFHTEKKEMPVYSLVVDKPGSKMKPNNSPEPYEIPIRGAGRGKIAAQRCSMSYFTWVLAQQAGRPVLDKTGLPGFYDFTFEWMPQPVTLPGTDGADASAGGEGPSLFTALREQLGLRLDAGKGPVEVMVIDQIGKPTAN